MKKAKTLAMIVVMALICTILPITTFAAGTTSVSIGGITLSDGANSIGGGTATLNKADNTLTLENVLTTDWIEINSDNEFTVIAKGSNSIGTVQNRTNGTALWSSSVTELNITIMENAELAFYTENRGNNIYVNSGSVNISGPGKLIADTVDGYPTIAVENGDLNFKGGLQAEITSEGHGLFAYKGNINIENSDLTVEAGSVGLFAEVYDYDTEDDLPSSVSIKNSTVDLKSEDHGVFCGSGGILVDNTVLTTRANKDIEYFEGYSLYADGGIIIKGSNTVIDADDGLGIAAEGGVLTIEAGKIDINSTDTALSGWEGVTISGGTITATAQESAAILANSGLISITGAETKVSAISDSSNTAAISNGLDGGIYADADVMAQNTAGYTPIEGKKRDKSTAITLGEGVGASNVNGQTVSDVKIYHAAGNVFSYFVHADGESTEAVTDTIKTCKHTWGEPVWAWNADHTGAEAEFVCTKDALHKHKAAGTVSYVVTNATCTQAGKTEYTATVEFNGKTYSDVDTVTIPVADHRTERHNANSPTCSQNGNSVYWYCADCGKYFSDEGCMVEIALADTVIPATGEHTFKDGKCTVCGAADPGYKPAEPSKPSNPEESKPSDIPQTGDTGNLWVIALAMMLSAGGFALTILFRRAKTHK